MRNTLVFLVSMVLMINVLIIDGHAIPRDINDKKGVSLYKRTDSDLDSDKVSDQDSDQDPGPSQDPVTGIPDPLLQDFLELTVPVQVGATGKGLVVDAYMKKLLGDDLYFHRHSEQDFEFLKSGTKKLVKILKAKRMQDARYQAKLEEAKNLLAQFGPGSTPYSLLNPTQIHSELEDFASYLLQRHIEKKKLLVEISSFETGVTKFVRSAKYPVEDKFYDRVECKIFFLDSQEKMRDREKIKQKNLEARQQVFIEETLVPKCGCSIL